jgi:hypothetical protein
MIVVIFFLAEDLHVYGVLFFQDHLGGPGARGSYGGKSGDGGMSVLEFILSA